MKRANLKSFLLNLREVGLPSVGWVEPRNPTAPALTERSIKIIGYLFTVPIFPISNIQAIFDRTAYQR
jgi:hypothetical protein